ncbi:MAG: hypothetical protein HOO88_02680 [Kiritimatiellaceae bacterium]|nr:hypothetical protein [Kiritimatiellaceae bacterium]
MNSIAKYMYFSRAIDLTPEKDRYLRLPDSGMHRTVLMTPARAATFSSACSRRVIGAMTA